MINTIINGYKNTRIALYGLGSETERFLKEYEKKIFVYALLDGFCEEGELYGYPIRPLKEVIDSGIKLIIVIARPGSCKAIVKRIGQVCREHGIELYDVRGKNLLEYHQASYDFSALNPYRKASLIDRIDNSEVISFDLFDTLVVRKVSSYTDIFDLVSEKLSENKICFPNLAGIRLSAEKRLSAQKSPSLTEIYEEVLKNYDKSDITAEYLAEIEWDTDFSVIVSRKEMCSIFKYAVDAGKRVVITTDTYYSESQILKILDKAGLSGYEDLLVSCEYKTGKTGRLFDKLKEKIVSENILHIGDDETSDIIPANARGMETFRIYSGGDLFDTFEEIAPDLCPDNLSSRLKIGLFTAKFLNNPFVFERDNLTPTIESAYDIGYCICAPLITDFVIWLQNKMHTEGLEQVFFCARDGFLIKRLFEKIESSIKSVYFLTSRIAAIRAGTGSEEDISYVDAMKYFGDEEAGNRIRFDIADEVKESDRTTVILKKASVWRANYLKYVQKEEFLDTPTAMFDFVAKGTTQLYLGKFLKQKLKGFYFLQLEPEFMQAKGIEVEPFYRDEERDSSPVFENYYILETIITAPHPMVLGFDEDGDPIYYEETRNDNAVKCMHKIQSGIEDYFDDYISLLPESKWQVDKKADEFFLSLINHVKISDEDFLSSVVEDPFFGRMTDIKDVIDNV